MKYGDHVLYTPSGGRAPFVVRITAMAGGPSPDSIRVRYPSTRQYWVRRSRLSSIAPAPMPTPDGQINTGPAYENGEPRRISANYFDEIQIGTTLIRADRGQGNRYKGRLTFEGIGDSHCEFLMIAGPDFRGPGVPVEIMMMVPPRKDAQGNTIPESQQRFTMSIVRESDNPDGSEGPDKVMLDIDGHDNARGMNLFIMTGGITHPDDSATVGKIALQLSFDGTLEVWDQRGPMKNGVRPALRYDIAGDLKRLKETHLP